MTPALFILALVTPFVAAQTGSSASQSLSGSRSETVVPVTTTSFSVSQSFSGRTGVTVTVPIVFTFTPTTGVTQPTSVTTSNSSTIDSRTWPTAAATAEGGSGGGSNGAPLPGQLDNGQYGPDDDYIAAAHRNAAVALTATIGAFVVGIMALQ